MLVSTIVIFGLGNIPRKGLVITGTTIVLTGTNSLFALSTYYPLSLFLLGLSGMSGGIFITLSFTLLQTMADDEMRGRVIGLAMSAVMMLGLGFMLGGVLPTLSDLRFSPPRFRACGCLRTDPFLPLTRSAQS